MTERAAAFPRPHPSPSQAVQAFFRHWGGLLSLLSVVVAAMLLGMYIGGLHSRIERVENTLDLHGRGMTELQQSVQTLSTSLEGRLDTREVSIEGMEGVLVRLVAMEATLSSLSKEMGTTKHAVSESVKEMKSETGKIRTEMQKLSAPRDDGISKIIKEASAKDAKRPEEHKRPQKR